MTDRILSFAEQLATGMVPAETVGPGTATAIATGAVVPRGADAVVMVEYTDAEASRLVVRSIIPL